MPGPDGHFTLRITETGEWGLVAARRRRRLRKRKRTRRQLQGWGLVAATVVAVWMAGNWATVWPVLLAVLAILMAGGVGWGLVRAHRSAVDGARQ